MQTPPPINRWTYCLYNADDITGPARLSDCVRVVFIVLYRLRLISDDNAMNFVILRAPIRVFGEHWFERTTKGEFKILV